MNDKPFKCDQCGTYIDPDWHSFVDHYADRLRAMKWRTPLHFHELAEELGHLWMDFLRDMK